MAGIDQSRIIRFGRFEVDARAGEVRKDGVRIKLQQQPFQLLLALLRSAGDVVTREQLRQQLWRADTFVDFDHSLNAAIKRLRDALGDSADNPVFVETLARRGYRFIAPISGSSSGNGTIAAGIDGPRTRLLMWWVAMSTIAGTVAGAVIWMLWRATFEVSAH